MFGMVSGDGGLGGRVSAHLTNTIEKALVDMSEDLEDKALSGRLVSKVKGGRINESETKTVARSAFEVKVDVY